MIHFIIKGYLVELYKIYFIENENLNIHNYSFFGIFKVIVPTIVV